MIPEGKDYLRSVQILSRRRPFWALRKSHGEFSQKFLRFYFQIGLLELFSNLNSSKNFKQSVSANKTKPKKTISLWQKSSGIFHIYQIWSWSPNVEKLGTEIRNEQVICLSEVNVYFIILYTISGLYLFDYLEARKRCPQQGKDT